MATAPKKVLLLGVHMNPGEPFPESHLLKLIDSDVNRGKDHNLDIQYQLTYSNNPEYGTIVARLKEQPWDIVAIGAGVRFPKERSELFEWLVNAAVKFASPTPRLVFNDKPDGVVDAVLRSEGWENKIGQVP